MEYQLPARTEIKLMANSGADQDKRESKQARLGSALRANLRKRKSQAKERQTSDPDANPGASERDGDAG